MVSSASLLGTTWMELLSHFNESIIFLNYGLVFQQGKSFLIQRFLIFEREAAVDFLDNPSSILLYISFSVNIEQNRLMHLSCVKSCGFSAT